AVGRTFARLYILHATGFQAPEGTVIGSYTVRYADKSKLVIEVVYGKDVRDWWNSEDAKGVSRGKLVWQEQNKAVKGLERQGCKIRLFMTTWTNPHPKKKVVAIDYATDGKTKAAPFCVALTAGMK